MTKMGGQLVVVVASLLAATCSPALSLEANDIVSQATSYLQQSSERTFAPNQIVWPASAASLQLDEGLNLGRRASGQLPTLLKQHQLYHNQVDHQKKQQLQHQGKSVCFR